jgi:hypothetical protein
MRPIPIAPMLILLLGAFLPITLAGTMVGNAEAGKAEIANVPAAPFTVFLRKFLRELEAVVFFI